MSPMPEVGLAPGTNGPGRWMLQRDLVTNDQAKAFDRVYTEACQLDAKSPREVT